MPKHGGQRKGSGRKKGGKNSKTIETQVADEQFRQKVLKKLDPLFNAQYSLARGQTVLIRIDEYYETKVDDDGKKRRMKQRRHVVVDDPDEIAAFFDELDGANGVVDENYYYLTAKPPDNKALDSLLNRALGKPKEHLDVTTDDEPIGRVEYVLPPEAVAGVKKRKKKDDDDEDQEQEDAEARADVQTAPGVPTS